MILHDRIMALPIDKDAHPVEKIGFRIARKEAAIIAEEADKLMAEMAAAMLEYDAMACRDEFGDILQKYWSWKESTK